MSAIKNLVSEIVDYAGLFPPAKLPLDVVTENYEHYLGSSSRWMLARLIIPAGRLIELEKQPSFTNSSHHWKISSLVPEVNAEADAFSVAMRAIDDFNSRHEDTGRAVVDAIEVKASSTESIEKTIAQIPETINAFLELPHQQDPDELVKAIAGGPDNIFAKIRTGGVTTNLIPPADQVARFIARCAQHDVGFKATAGLHHPIRGNYRLTYETDADCGNMFGFVNVFVAAAFAFAGQDEAFLAKVLSETEATNFEVSEDAIVWNGNSISSDQISTLRNQRAISFGSCSFAEPTEELSQLGWINIEVA